MRGEPAYFSGDAGDGEVRRGSFLRGIHRGAGGARGVCEQGVHDGSVYAAEQEREAAKERERPGQCKDREGI